MAGPEIVCLYVVVFLGTLYASYWMVLGDDVRVHVERHIADLAATAENDGGPVAAAVAWSARRVALGQAVCLPDPPETFSDGLPLRDLDLTDAVVAFGRSSAVLSCCASSRTRPSHAIPWH